MQLKIFKTNAQKHPTLVHAHQKSNKNHGFLRFLHLDPPPCPKLVTPAVAPLGHALGGTALSSHAALAADVNLLRCQLYLDSWRWFEPENPKVWALTPTVWMCFLGQLHIPQKYPQEKETSVSGVLESVVSFVAFQVYNHRRLWRHLSFKCWDCWHLWFKERFENVRVRQTWICLRSLEK